MSESLIPAGDDARTPSDTPPPARESRPWRERLAVLDALVDAALGALVTLRIEADGRPEVVYASPAVDALFGVTPAALRSDARAGLNLIHPDDLAASLATMATSVAERAPAAFELRVLHPRHGERWVDVRAAVTDEGDGCSLVHAVVTDVTSRKHAELELRARDAELAEAQRIGHIGSWNATSQGVLASREFYRLHGLSEAAPVTRERILASVHPDDRARLDAELTQRIAAGRDFSVEYRVLDPDGRVRWLQGRHEFVLDAAGQVVGRRGTVQDVTESVEAQVALRRRVEVERQLSELAAAAPVVLCIFHERRDGGWSFTFAADGIRDIYGLTPEQVAADGSAILAVIHPEDWARVRVGFARASLAMKPWHDEFRVRHPTRGELWVEGRAVPTPADDGGKLWHGSLADVTARKRTELALALRERELAEAHRVARMGNWEWRIHDGRMNAAPELRAVVGLGPGAPLDETNTLAVVHPDDRERIVTVAAAALAAGEPFAMDFRLAGTEPPRWIHCRGEGVLDNTGALTTVRGICQDITERRRAEESMRRIVALNPAVLYAMRNEGPRFVLLWRSGNLARLTGDAADSDDEQQEWFERVHPDDRARVLAAHPTPYDVAHQVLEYRLRCADGRWIWLRDEKRLVRGEGDGSAEIVGALSDVTARVELERQLRQSQKMEAIGVLAGGVAHDFNNLLTVIGASTELLRSTAPDGAARDELLDEIAQATDRATALTRQLLLFSRHEVVTPRVLSPNEVLRSTEKLLVRLIGEDVRLTSRLQVDAGFVRIDPAQLEQVVLNLAVNARDAMPRGGELRIETAAVTLEEAFCRTHERLSPGRYVRLTVRDTGCGMSQEVRSRIFEPFYTTKGVGKGTGLGLATVFGVVTRHGGAVEVTSEVGRGSRFDVYLPAVDPAPRTATSLPSPFQTPVSGETILLVEDDKAVRSVARVALEQRGYRVIEAAAPDEAIEVVRRADREIHLLLTDVVMPGMSGPDLAREIQALRPGVCVLFMSGYVDDAVTRHGLQASDAFLAKPFTPRGLALRVRERLDACGG
jgi:two-component system cell cycle sensor histidine kinase/response regulator CckA